jgi:Co/Zn/Cd efflux system component
MPVQQVLGALINSVCLVSLAGYLILSAIPLLIQPHAEGGFRPSKSFIGVAALGVVINVASSFLLCCGGTDSEGNPNFVHSHVGCACDHGDASKSSKSNSDCMDACCTPPVLTEESLQVPFGFVGKKKRMTLSQPDAAGPLNRQNGPAPIIVSDVESPSIQPRQSFDFSTGEDRENIKKSPIRKLAGRGLRWREMDANLMAVMIHSAGDACSSLVVFGVGLTVYYIRHHGNSAMWADYLDPAVTIFLSSAMAYAVKGILIKCFNLLLEKSALTVEELSILSDNISRDKHIYKHGLVAKELIVTNIDFDGTSRRANIVLVVKPNHSLAMQTPFDQSTIRKRVKYLLKERGVKYAAVEIRPPGDSSLLGIDEDL